MPSTSDESFRFRFPGEGDPPRFLTDLGGELVCDHDHNSHIGAFIDLHRIASALPRLSVRGWAALAAPSCPAPVDESFL